MPAPSPSIVSPRRREFLSALSGIGIGTAVFHRALVAQVEQNGQVTAEMVAQAEWIAGIELDEEERDGLASAIDENLRSAERLRALAIDADTAPALVFRPDFFYEQAKSEADRIDGGRSFRSIQVGWSVQSSASRLSDSELAFAGILEQASLLAEGRISSRELTQLYLTRLKKYDPLLNCVVTLLEEHAIEQSEASDRRRARHQTFGVLDGIPWVAKDLVAMPPWKTTWGAEPFQNQVRQEKATVASRLDDSGAVCLAKVTLGALAWGDKWFGGLTRNPWNPEQGSSGSSAGSASAVAAGLATFGLGSETLGSIVSPTRRCRTSGLRPTFGRVSRAGCMPLAWSMDKIGPIARHADDLAYVFAALLGSDGRDPTVVERDFHWPIDLKIRSLTIGISGDPLDEMEQRALDFLQSEGARVVEIDLTTDLPVQAMEFILGVEASTVFDDVFRQEPKADYGNWPNTFRRSQFIPAIQYLRANRIRSQLVAKTEEKLSPVDVVLGGNDLLLTNLSGHPSIVVSCGQVESRGVPVPGVVKLTAAAYREERLLHVAKLLQRAMPASPAQPPLDAWLGKMQSSDKGDTQNERLN